MALNDSYMYPASDLTLEKVIRDRNSRTSQALREVIGLGGGGGGGGETTPSVAVDPSDSDYAIATTGGGAAVDPLDSDYLVIS